MSKGIVTRLRLSSLRLRLVVVFALVALTAAVAASGIAYWLNREAVLTRTQDGALNDFRQEMQNRAATLPLRPTQEDLRRTAELMATGSANYQVLLLGERDAGKPIVGASDPDDFTLADVPRSLREAVDTERPVTEANPYPYHLFWQRTERNGTPYLVGGTRIDGGGPMRLHVQVAGRREGRPELARLVPRNRDRARRGRFRAARAGRGDDRAAPGAPARRGRQAARRGQARHPAPGHRCRRTGRPHTDVQQRGRVPAEEGRGHERPRGVLPAVRRRHVARAADPADRAHRRHGGPGGRAGLPRPDDRPGGGARGQRDPPPQHPGGEPDGGDPLRRGHRAARPRRGGHRRPDHRVHRRARVARRGRSRRRARHRGAARSAAGST